MQPILSYFWQICLLRTGPEKIPASATITGMLLVIYLTTAFISIAITRPNLAMIQTIAAVFIGFIIEAAIIYGLLVLKSVGGRFLSTISAVLGSNSILLIILLPIQLLANNLNTGIVSSFISALLFVCFLWWITIVGFILHRVANVSVLQGTVIALMIEFLFLIASATLFPIAG